MYQVSIKNLVNISEEWKKRYWWLSFSINKWQCIKYVEYNKILFLDIDILPVYKKFYEIFNLHTPAFKIYGTNVNYTHRDCKNNHKFSNILNNVTTFSDYVKKSKKSFYSIDGGILLLKPDIKNYNGYIKFISFLDKKKKLPNFKGSGVDETTIFFYYMKYATKKIYSICSDYATIPNTKKYTFSHEQSNKITKAYNFRSHVKPWSKTKIIGWPEEHIWIDIYYKMYKTTNFKNYLKIT